MFDLGGGELLLIVLAVLVLFGPKKLPELAQSLGRGMREFKRAQREFTDQINQAVSDEHYKSKKQTVDAPRGVVARNSTRSATPTTDDGDFVNQVTTDEQAAMARSTSGTSGAEPDRAADVRAADDL